MSVGWVDASPDAGALSVSTDNPLADQVPGAARHLTAPESAEEPRLKVELDAVIAQWVRRVGRGRSTSRSARRRGS